MLGIAGDNPTSEGFSALGRVLVLGFQCRDRSIVRNHHQTAQDVCIDGPSLERHPHQRILRVGQTLTAKSLASSTLCNHVASGHRRPAFGTPQRPCLGDLWEKPLLFLRSW